MKSKKHSKSSEKKKFGGADSLFDKRAVSLIVIAGLLVLFNQFQISGISGQLGYGGSGSLKVVSASEISEIKSTAQAIATLFPVGDIRSEEDAIAIMIAQGTPEYGESMGISYDDPVGGMTLLASNYNAVKKDIQQNYPEVWERYLNLATKPVGISCEFCCGVGPVGITKTGDLRCGCQHNPAVQSLTMLLMKDTDYDDAQILQEVIKWKTLFYPRDMVGLAMQVSGGELDAGNLPGMVGGC